MLTVDGVPLCTSGDAAKLLGLTVGSLRNAISAGRVELRPVNTIGKAYLYSVADVAAEAERRNNLR